MVSSLIVTERLRKTAVRARPMKRSKQRDKSADTRTHGRLFSRPLHFWLDSRNENLPEKRIHRNYALTTVPMSPGSRIGQGLRSFLLWQRCRRHARVAGCPLVGELQRRDARLRASGERRSVLVCQVR